MRQHTSTNEQGAAGELRGQAAGAPPRTPASLLSPWPCICANRYRAAPPVANAGAGYRGLRQRSAAVFASLGR